MASMSGFTPFGAHLVVLDHLAETGVAFTEPAVELWYPHPASNFPSGHEDLPTAYNSAS